MSALPPSLLLSCSSSTGPYLSRRAFRGFKRMRLCEEIAPASCLHGTLCGHLVGLERDRGMDLCFCSALRCIYNLPRNDEGLATRAAWRRVPATREEL